MEIEKKTSGKTMTMSLIGRIDTTASEKLKDELLASCETYNKVILDLGRTDYISSAGLRALLTAHKAMGRKGGISIVNVQEDVMEVFRVTGFCNILSFG